MEDNWKNRLQDDNKGNITRSTGFGTSTILFFGWGAYIAINRKNLICEFRKFEKPCYIVAIVSLILATIYQGNRNEIGHYFYCIYVISGVMILLDVWRI